jgi:hypothetical protein
MPLANGTRTGVYEVVAIGAGGMAEVYRARDADQRRPELAAKPSQLRMKRLDTPLAFCSAQKVLDVLRVS